MAEKRKFYWLKLKDDFFKRHDIRIIEKMPNGKDYVLFYLKLLVESVSHDGNLRFSDTIPYNEEMLATITDTNIDVVKTAMKLFKELQLVEILDDATIYMTEVQKMLGFETNWAKAQREYREKQKLITQKEDNVFQKVDNVYSMSTECLPNVDQEIEIEIEKELEKDKKKKETNKKRNKSNMKDFLNNSNAPSDISLEEVERRLFGE